MRIYKTPLSEVPTDKEAGIIKSTDIPYDASNPLAEILEAMRNLKDGEILRIVPIQGGEDYA